MKPAMSPLRRLTLVEGVSFLVLLGIAMPLKYLGGMPMAVKVFGWLHGLLFVGLCWLLLLKLLKGWSVVRCAVVFIASLLPFGPFLIDGRIAAWENEGRNPEGSP